MDMTSDEHLLILGNIQEKIEFLDILIAICKRVREEFFFPGARADGFCHTVSTQLVLELRKEGYNARRIMGEYMGEDYSSHTWVELGDLLIDCTISQFEYYYLYDIAIGPYSEFPFHRR